MLQPWHMNIVLQVMYRQGVKEHEFVLWLFKQLVPYRRSSFLYQTALSKFWVRFLQRTVAILSSQLASCTKKMPLPWNSIQIYNQIKETFYKILWPTKTECALPPHGKGKKMKQSQYQKYSQQQGMLTKLLVAETPIEFWVYQVADEDLESSVLLARHIQSGHGKLYIESFGLLSSTPFESLCDLMLSSWRLRLFHLESNQSRSGVFRYFLLSKKYSTFLLNYKPHWTQSEIFSVLTPKKLIAE